MGYEMGHPDYDAAGGSRVAARRPSKVNGRSGGTATSARARRSANGLQGYGNLAGYAPSAYDEGLGFSVGGLIKAVAKPVISLVPGGSTILQGASILGGLKGTNAKDQARIASALAAMNKALTGDANAYLLLRQGAGLVPGYGSATAVGKEAFKRALAYVDSQRAAPPTPTLLQTPLVASAIPMVQQVANAGLTLATQQTANGGTQVVATNPSTGAVVSSPLPIPPSAVPTNAASLPANAVQAAAPPSAVDASPSQPSGIFSILDKLSQQINASTAASQNAQSQAAVSAATGGGVAPSAPTTDNTPPATPPGANDDSNKGKGVSPVLLIGVAAGLGFLLMSGHGGRR